MATSSIQRFRRTVAVAAIALGAVACGGGDTGTTGGGAAPGAASGAPGEVAISGFKFVPADIEVAPGTTVTWTNQDETPHTVQDEGEDQFEESQELQQGETFTFTYETPGSYPYICGIHPYMKGTVTVT